MNKYEARDKESLENEYYNLRIKYNTNLIDKANKFADNWRRNEIRKKPLYNRLISSTFNEDNVESTITDWMNSGREADPFILLQLKKDFLSKHQPN